VDLNSFPSKTGEVLNCWGGCIIGISPCIHVVAGLESFIANFPVAPANNRIRSLVFSTPRYLPLVQVARIPVGPGLPNS